MWGYAILTGIAMVLCALVTNATGLLLLISASGFMFYYHGTRFSELRYREFSSERADALEQNQK